ncbi:hypothetical protein LTR86_008798 [Recurvomyces mirabilis]|nr:hypothetical protein LTR86_008798 [Recurvomyces mirabilis]
MQSKPLVPESDRYGILSGFNPSKQVLKAGTKIAAPFLELPIDIIFDKDVAVTLRDGTVTYVDLFRPVGDEAIPVIVAFSPYGKGQGTSSSARGVFRLVGLEDQIVSGLEKFEGPDPAYWCAHGYAICNPDIRGVAESQGDSVLWDRQEGRDAYDLVEWLGLRDWCNGKVAMSGTSYLAASQWFTAAEQPPHLAAINPWEGMSDTYRDLVMRGGIPDHGFAKQLRDYSFWGHGQKEDIIAEADQYPLMNKLWAEKIPAYSKITAPAYVVASYSNSLHTQGTFRAWRRMTSGQKWLRIHNSQEWPDYYDERNREDLRRFFDHFLLGRNNGWEATSPVRYSLLDLQGGDEVDIAAQEFPPAGTLLTKYYLNASSRTLDKSPSTHESSVQYVVGGTPGRVSFVFRFEELTTLVGYPKAHLRVGVDGADDMDLFILAQKLDQFGTPLAQFTVPNQGAMLQDATECGGSILRYRGSDGRLRVSLRQLDEVLSTHEIPAHTFEESQKLAAGEVVDVEIDMMPIGLSFRPGEQLRFVISGTSLLGSMMPGMPQYTSPFAGRHIIYTGGDNAAYVQLPIYLSST